MHLCEVQTGEVPHGGAEVAEDYFASFEATLTHLLVLEVPAGHLPTSSRHVNTHVTSAVFVLVASRSTATAGPVLTIVHRGFTVFQTIIVFTQDGHFSDACHVCLKCTGDSISLPLQLRPLCGDVAAIRYFITALRDNVTVENSCGHKRCILIEINARFLLVPENAASGADMTNAVIVTTAADTSNALSAFSVKRVLLSSCAINEIVEIFLTQLRFFKI